MRAFLALDFPESVKSAYARVLEEFRSRVPGLRWVQPAGLHLTLRFLGAIGGEAADALRPEVAGAAAEVSAGTLVLGSPGSFGSRSVPDAFWFSVVEGKPTLTPFQNRLEELCRERGFAPEHRAFAPHVTIARAPGRRRSRQSARRPIPSSSGWEEMASASGLVGAAFPVAEVALLTSRPAAQGSIYTPVWKERFKA